MGLFDFLKPKPAPPPKPPVKPMPRAGGGLPPLPEPKAKNNFVIVILDSCRNNPFKSRIEGVRALGGGLAEYTSAAAGLLIAFATKGGQTAEDGTGAHSPFTEALLKHIRTPNLEINEMLLLVRQDVYKATGAKQWPALKNSLLGLFYLVDQRAQATAK